MLNARTALGKASARRQSVIHVLRGTSGARTLAGKSISEPADGEPADGKPADGNPADGKPADWRPCRSGTGLSVGKSDALSCKKS